MLNIINSNIVKSRRIAFTRRRPHVSLWSYNTYPVLHFVGVVVLTRTRRHVLRRWSARIIQEAQLVAVTSSQRLVPDSANWVNRVGHAPRLRHVTSWCVRRRRVLPHFLPRIPTPEDHVISADGRSCSLLDRLSVGTDDLVSSFTGIAIVSSAFPVDEFQSLPSVRPSAIRRPPLVGPLSASAYSCSLSPPRTCCLAFRYADETIASTDPST